MAEGFLGRWSRRKLDVKEGRAPEAEPAIDAATPAQPSVGGQGSGLAPGAEFVHPPGEGQGGGIPPAAGAADAQVREAPPTLEDTDTLTPHSDFTRFVRRDVPADVKNAALKKLFADPHFNVMDGLDVYIDDYGKPDPIPESTLRQLASAQFLNLFREEEESKQDELAGAPREDADDTPRATVAQSAQGEAADESFQPPPQAGPDHGHADLQLQPDDAPGRPGPGPGTG